MDEDVAHKIEAGWLKWRSGWGLVRPTNTTQVKG